MKKKSFEKEWQHCKVAKASVFQLSLECVEDLKCKFMIYIDKENEHDALNVFGS